jgi:hypothetical protein
LLKGVKTKSESGCSDPPQRREPKSRKRREGNANAEIDAHVWLLPSGRLPVRLYLELENYWKTPLVFAYLRASSSFEVTWHSISFLCDVRSLRPGFKEFVPPDVDAVYICENASHI